MKTNTLLLIVLTSFIFSLTQAQDTWNWGDSPKEAKGNYMYLKTVDIFLEKNFQSCLKIL